MELTERQARRPVDEEPKRRRHTRFENGEAMLNAFRDLFDCYEEMDEFADSLQRMREEERARYRT
jgi:hypothetical protein